MLWLSTQLLALSTTLLMLLAHVLISRYNTTLPARKLTRAELFTSEAKTLRGIFSRGIKYQRQRK